MAHEELETWLRDLRAAGWEEVRLTVWRCPKGYLWRGPFGAWRELQRRNVASVPMEERS